MEQRVALLSVSDLRGLKDFAARLLDLNFVIYATENTRRNLVEAGLAVRDVSEITGFPSILGGRVKTIHPLLYAGILASRSRTSHMEEVERLNCPLIDIVVVNPYPLPREGMSLEDVVERIDIGGIGLLRAAAKNFEYVTVICDPGDYGRVIEELTSEGAVSLDTKKLLAAKALDFVTRYDQEIARVLNKALFGKDVLYLGYERSEKLRYGENWHQNASLYVDRKPEGFGIARARRLGVEHMSFNNFLDADAALWAASDLAEYTVSSVVIKHTSLCAAATGPAPLESLKAAWDGDPVSSYGGVLAFTYPVNLDVARFLSERFIEVVLALSFSEESVDVLLKKNRRLRLLELGEMGKRGEAEEYRFISGGLLVQDRDLGYTSASEFRNVTKAEFPKEKLELARFACIAAKHVKSNAVVIAREYRRGFYQTVGIGGGQPNRVDAISKLAIPRALEFCKRNGLSSVEVLGECVLASDSFFPFPDSIEVMADAGLRYVVQPGGSKRDPEVIGAADRNGMAMLFTGRRCFRH